MSKIISVQNLQKHYKQNKVLKDISFSVEKGEIFSLLGINGAGKTTALECMEGIRSYNGGNIELFGSVGVQLQSSSLPENIQAMEAIKLFAKWNNCCVDMDYLKRLGVEQIKKKRYIQMSTGQKRRLHLALAMITNPDIIFLDEPTAGLDVEGQVALHEEIRRIKAQGKTIIMASHDMSEIEELSDKIAILRNGTIAFYGTAKELTQHMQGIQKIRVKFNVPFNQPNFINCVFKEMDHDYFVFETNELTKCLQELSSIAIKLENNIVDIQIDRLSLEQCFIDISKEEE